MKLVITFPGTDYSDGVAEYVHFVADQIEDGYVSGHVDADRHWALEETS